MLPALPLFILGIIVLVVKQLRILEVSQKNPEVKKQINPVYIKQINNWLNDLTKTFTVHEDINDIQLRNYFALRDYKACTIEIMNKMGLKNRIKVTCYPDHHSIHSRPNIAAYVNIPSDIPMYGSDRFNRMTFMIYISKSATIRYETFVYTLAHEMSHIVLNSMHHKCKESEEATDLLVMVKGFSRIMKDCIHDYECAGDYEPDGYTRINYNRTITRGYLGDGRFEIAEEYLNNLKKHR